MTNTLDLKNIEKKAFRSVHQDGLLDIGIGGIVLCMSIWSFSTDSEEFPLFRFGLFLAGMVVFQLIYWGGKRYYTVPRLGQVKFGPRRQQRALTMAILLAGIILLQVLIVAGTILLWKNPGWAASLGFAQTGPDRERLLVAVIGAMFVGPSLALLAYFSEFMRGYYIALILSLAVFSMIWFGQPIYMTVSALLILIPGVVLFICFLHNYPLPPADASHE
jgi:hypothetical protein